MRFNLKLAESYANSNYWIMLPDSVLFLRPWVKDKSLLESHYKYKANTSAIISPCNPHSKKLGGLANKKLLASFRKFIGNKWRYFPSAGSSIESGKESEKSYFILGIKKADATQLARRYGQDAFVYFTVTQDGVTPQLIATVKTNQIILNKVKRRKTRIRSEKS